jgi:hypothetical protein
MKKVLCGIAFVLAMAAATSCCCNQKQQNVVEEEATAVVDTVAVETPADSVQVAE